MGHDLASPRSGQHRARRSQSHYSFTSLVRVAILILTGYSTMPLRLASWVGFVMTLFGLGVFAYTLFVYFTQGSLPGFPFLASIILLWRARNCSRSGFSASISPASSIAAWTGRLTWFARRGCR